jgi:hypothetical protein
VTPTDSLEKIECEPWLYGAKWQGLTDNQIDAIEKEFAIKFTVEHRAFLRILHAIDRYEYVDLEEDDGSIITGKRPYFYNWLVDHDTIKKYLHWPYDTILNDVLGKPNVWLRSWGKRPDSTHEKETVFAKWYHKAPPLLPLQAHTFLISDPNLENRPVLSVWGADTIIKGWSLKAYLVSEFVPALGLLEMKYSVEDNLYYPEYKEGIEPIIDEYFQFELKHHLPYWEEIIRYYGHSHNKK